MHCQHVAFNSMTHKFAETNKPLDAQAPFFEPSLLLSTIIVRSMNMFTFSSKTCVFCFGFFGFMTDPLNGNLLHCFLPNFLSIQTRLFFVTGSIHQFVMSHQHVSQNVTVSFFFCVMCSAASD